MAGHADRGIIIYNVQENAWVVSGLLQDHLNEDACNDFVPVMGRTKKDVYSLPEDIEITFIEFWFDNWRTNNCDFIIEEDSIAEGVFTFSLSEFTTVFDPL